MKSLGLIAFALTIFAGSAALSWYLNTHTPAASAQQPAPEAVAQPTSTATDEPAPAPQPVAPDELPVAVRPRAMSVEEIVRYGMGLKAREESLKQREQTLQRQEAQQKMALADIQAEQKELESILQNVRSQREAAATLLQQVEAQRQQLQSDKQAAETDLKKTAEARISIDAEFRDNTKRMADWLQAMEPDKSAEILRELANNGQMETAVQMLSNFEERDAAKILESIGDTKLVSEFVEAFRSMKRPEKQTATRR